MYSIKKQTLSLQDSAPPSGVPEDLAVCSSQAAQNKRPLSREGEGGYPSRTMEIQPTATPKQDTRKSPCSVFIPQCQGTKTDGARCGSPAMRRQKFCYFHDPKRQRRIVERAIADGEPLPDFRDPMKMLHWATTNLAAGRISTKAAGQLIYAVQQRLYR